MLLTEFDEKKFAKSMWKEGHEENFKTGIFHSKMALVRATCHFPVSPPRIAQLERENEQLRAELEVYKNRNTGGRKKHDEAWMTSYRDFAVKYEGGMTIMEIVAQGEISRRTAYRYKAYYDEVQKNNRYKKRNEQVLSGINPTR